MTIGSQRSNRRRGVLGRSVSVLCAPALLVWLTGCEALVPYHRYSAEHERETTAIVLETVSARDSVAVAVVVPRDGAQASLKGDPLNFESRLQQLIGRAVSSASRPPSMWGAKTAGEFYASAPRALDSNVRGEHGALVEIRPGVRGFRIERSLAGERVCTIEFSILPVDGAFRVTLERVKMLRSRAKVADMSWRNWWTRIPCLYGFGFDVAALFGMSYGDEAVDMQVDLEFTANWTDANGGNNFAPLAVLGWTVPDVELGGGTRVVGASSGWLPIVPPSIGDVANEDRHFGMGRFVVSAFVTEQDELSQEFASERRSLGEYVNEILSLLPIPTVPGL